VTDVGDALSAQRREAIDGVEMPVRPQEQVS
jgi:hypothetical protein